MSADAVQIRLGELLENHARFPALFIGVDRPTALYDRTGQLVAVNPAGLAVIGCTFDELAGRRWEALVESGTDVRLRAGFLRAARGKVTRLIAEFRNATGEDVVLETSLTPAVVDGEIVGVYACAADVTSLRRAERDSARRVQQFHSLFNYHTDSVVALDRFGYCIEANPAAERLLGFSSAELRGRAYSSLVAPEMLAHSEAIFKRCLAGESVSENNVVVHRDGRRIEVAGTLVPIVMDEVVVGVHAVGHDITARRHVERTALEQVERIRELYLVAADTNRSARERIASALYLGARRLGCDGGYLTLIADNVVTFVQCTGEAKAFEGLQRPLAGSLDGAVAAAADPISGDVGAGEILEGEQVARAFIGTAIGATSVPARTVTFTSRAPRAPFATQDFEFIQLIGTLVASILEREEQDRNLDELAFSDALTGLPNRLMLRDRLSEEIAIAQLHGSSFALHFYDLDGFKHINDVHGHQRGDEVLCTIAHRLEGLANGNGIVARLGGDEFVVVQPKATGRDEAERLARRLCDAVNEPVHVDGQVHRLSASAGIAFYPQHGADATTLLGRADAALYRVKALGRNAIAFADDG